MVGSNPWCLQAKGVALNMQTMGSPEQLIAVPVNPWLKTEIVS